MVYNPYASYYSDAGFGVMPVRGKIPILNNWQQFCECMPTPDQALSFLSQHPDLNIGVPLGPASSLVALDVDLDFQDKTHYIMWEILEDIIPYSIAEKVGAKGFTRFYQYESQSSEVLKLPFSTQIEVLSGGRQTVVPPSVHPKGMPYKWTNEPLYKLKQSHLPLLEPWDLDKIRKACEQLRKQYPQHKAKEIIGGRNNRLKGIATAMLTRNEDEDKIITELVKEDLKHPVPLFTDQREGYRGSAEEGADRFITNIKKSLTRANKIKTIKAIKQSTYEEPKEKPPEELPLSKGLMTELYGAICYATAKKTDVYHDWAAILAMQGLSTVMSNKYQFNDSYSNHYTFIIGDSSSGKTQHVKSLTRILEQARLTKLLSQNFKSSKAMLAYLQSHREFLSIIDEASWLLTAAKNSGSHFSDAKEILSDLWSMPGSTFKGRFGASDAKDSKEKDVFSPCANVIFMTPSDEFNECVGEKDVTQGLLNRCFVVSDFGGRLPDEHPKPNLPKLNSELNALANMKTPNSAIYDGQSVAISIELEPQSKKLYKELMRKYRDLAKNEEDKIIRLLVGKFPEHLNKLCLASVISRDPDPYHGPQQEYLPLVTAYDIEYAEKFLDLYYKKYLVKLPESFTLSAYHRNLKAVLNYTRGSRKPMRLRDVRRKFQHLGQQLRNILEDLEDQEYIISYNDPGGNKAGRPSKLVKALPEFMV